VLSAHHPHALQLCNQRRAGRAKCDVCRQRGECVRFCASCDWDICSTCLSLEQQQSSSSSSEESLIEAAILETVERLSQSLSSSDDSPGCQLVEAEAFFAPASEQDRLRADASSTEDALLEAALLESMSTVPVEQQQQQMKSSGHDDESLSVCVSYSRCEEESKGDNDDLQNMKQAETDAAASAAIVIVSGPPQMKLLGDATFPDGTQVAPGVLFRKAWRVSNCGSYPWPAGVSLVQDGGDDLMAAGAGILCGNGSRRACRSRGGAWSTAERAT